MAEGLMLEFQGVGKEMYDAVNAKLGLDPTTRAGDWPEGLVTHAGGSGDDGSFVVYEVWESQELQGQWMGARLAPALEEVGVPEPSRVTWFALYGQYIA